MRSCFPSFGVYNPRRGLANHAFFVNALTPNHLKTMEVDKESKFEPTKGSGSQQYQEYLRDSQGKASKLKRKGEKSQEETPTKVRKAITFGV
jgi:hypothetical protein